ncbi:MAG: hypothetical protein ACI8RD_008916, partial [Bacillariaceae sp.]
NDKKLRFSQKFVRATGTFNFPKLARAKLPM